MNIIMNTDIRQSFLLTAPAVRSLVGSRVSLVIVENVRENSLAGCPLTTHDAYSYIEIASMTDSFVWCDMRIFSSD